MAPAGDGRSGGKMLKQKRTYRKTTPYDRPPPPPPAAEAGRGSSNHRNWLTGFIYPATTKLFSSFWNPMIWSPSSSSSSSSSSDDDADSEDGPEDYVQAPDVVIELNQKRSDSPGMLETYGNDVQLYTLRKSETLHLIEQLLMHEHFSREECDRLTEIINSRVVPGSMKEGIDAGPSEIPSRRTNSEHPAICSQAVAQSKKWVEEKKLGSSSKSVLDNGVCALSSSTKQIVEGETTSPVDMAKSYMQARPPWASPDIVHNHIRNSSPVAAQLFKEGTTYSKDYLSSGSWNIQEELRKLRSKATEDMLSTYRFTENASTEPKYKATAYSLAADKNVNVIKSPELDSLIAQKSVEEPLNVDAGVTSHILSALELTHANLPTEALESNAKMILALEHNQDLDSVKMVERDGAASESHQTVAAEQLMDQHMVVEETTLEGEAAANNSATSGINLPSGIEREQDNGPPIEGNCSENREDSLQPEEGNVLEQEENSTSAERNPNVVSLSETLVEVPSVDGNPNVVSLSETSVEVPSVNENISIIDVSQTVLGSESTPVTEKAPGRKSGRYSRRGRGRGNL